MSNIIFDWTGVVKDAAEDHLRVVNLMFEDLGTKPITMQQLKSTWKQPFMDFYNTHLPSLTMEQQKEAYFKAFAQVPGAKAYPGMVELIKELKSKGFTLAILSSDHPNSILNEIKNFGLEDIFDDMDLEVHDKVHHIADLMNRNSMKLNNTIIIGDTNNEIEAARSVGIKAISVTWGLCSQENLEKYEPDYLVNTVEELRETIFSKNL